MERAAEGTLMLNFYSFFTHLVLFIDLFDYLFAYLFI